MSSSRRANGEILFRIYLNRRTVFRLTDVAMITGESDFVSLNRKLNYYVKTGKLLNPRKGIYAKPDYNFLELACILYTPCYISLEYVLQKAGIIFQYDPSLTVVSYLTRSIRMDEQVIRYRKIRGEIMVDLTGIIRGEDFINLATPERAFLDLLYLNGDIWPDNTSSLDKILINKLLPIYRSKTMIDRIAGLF